jgi:uncharacterized protein
VPGPAPRADRLEFVDALRGFALFGVFWANLLLFCGINYLTDAQRSARFPGPLDRFAFGFERFLVENKFICCGHSTSCASTRCGPCCCRSSFSFRHGG